MIYNLLIISFIYIPLLFSFIKVLEVVVDLEDLLLVFTFSVPRLSHTVDRPEPLVEEGVIILEVILVEALLIHVQPVPVTVVDLRVHTPKEDRLLLLQAILAVPDVYFLIVAVVLLGVDPLGEGDSRVAGDTPSIHLVTSSTARLLLGSCWHLRGCAHQLQVRSDHLGEVAAILLLLLLFVINILVAHDNVVDVAGGYDGGVRLLHVVSCCCYGRHHT